MLSHTCGGPRLRQRCDPPFPVNDNDDDHNENDFQQRGRKFETQGFPQMFSDW